MPLFQSNAYSSYPTRSGEKWAELRKGCPVCGHAGWCRGSPDGSLIACRRLEQGCFKSVQYKDQTPAYLHALREDERWRVTFGTDTRNAPEAPRATDADLDRVYRVLLNRLSSLSTHRDALLARGLTADQVRKLGYKSLPPRGRATLAKGMASHFGAELLLTVPGFVMRQGDHGDYLTLSGWAGLLIPVRDKDAFVVGLVVRPDDPPHGTGKYTWLSSKSDGGPGPGARVHVPVGARQGTPDEPGEWLIVEGCLKADVAFALSGRPVIGLPGCHVTFETLDVLEAVGCTKPMLCLDADRKTNPHVGAAEADGLRKLEEVWGDDAGVMEWDAELGKGLDDVLLAMQQKTGQAS